MADVDVVSVRVKPNLRTFRTELRSELRSIDVEMSVKVTADTRVARAEIDQMLRDVDNHLKIHAEVDRSDFATEMAALSRDQKVKVNVDTSQVKALLKLTDGVLGNVLKLGVAFTKLTVGVAALAAAGHAAVVLTSGLLAVSHVAAILPGLFAGAALAIGTIKLGADGIKKAFTGLEPTIVKLKASISSTFAQGLTPAVNNAKVIIPQLTNGFREMAVALSSVAVKFTEAFKQQGGVASTNSLLKETAAITRDVAGAFGPLAIGLLNIAKIGLNAFKPFTSGLVQAAQHFADFTRSAEGIVKIQGFIQKGVDAFRSLGTIASNVGQTISGIFRAMKTASGSAFGGITDITGAMRDFVNSAQGQTALVSFFSSLRGVVAAVTPIIKTLADIIGNTLAPVIADIATAIGPSLNRVFQGIGEALKVASPGIVALATGFADMIDGLRPALPLLGEVASQLGSTLGDALRSLAPPFLQLIQDLAPQLPSVAEAVGKLAVAGIKLLDALTPLLGPIAEIAGLLADQLVPVFEALKPIIGPIADALGKALLSAMQQLAPVLPPLVQAFGQIVLALANGLIPILPGLVSLIGPVAQAFILLTPVVLGLAIPFIAATGAAVALAQALSGDVKGAIQTTKQTIQTTGALTKQIIETDWVSMAASVQLQASNISGSVANMGTNVQSEMATGIHGASSILQDGVGGWAGFVAAGTGDATAALGNGVAPWDDLVQGAMTGANGAVTGGMQDLVGEAKKGIGDATNEVGKLPPNINGQLSGTEQQMRNIANSMMQGLAQGIAIAGRAAVAAAQAIANQVVAIMSAVLRINSPSKVIRDKIGVAIPQGLAAGIEKDASVALNAASKMADDVVSASSAAAEGVSPNFSSTLTVQAAATSPIEIAANSAFDRVTEALEGWSVVLDARGVATLSRTGTVLNGKR